MAAHGPGCADGLTKLLETWRPLRSSASKEEYPTVCRLTSLMHKTAESCVMQESAPLPCTSYSVFGDTGQGMTRRHYEHGRPKKPEEGDLVIIGGHEVPTEFQSCSAVVKEVDAVYCTVAILDASRTYSSGECQLKFSDMVPVHKEWRIGARVVIGGLQSSKMKHLNGLTATVCQHRRYGHPCLLSQTESPGKAKLKLCVKWEDPKTDSSGALLVEPRFLSPYFRDRDASLDLRVCGEHLDASSTRASEGSFSAHDEANKTLLSKSRRQGAVDQISKVPPLPLQKLQASGGGVEEKKISEPSTQEVTAAMAAFAPTCAGNFLGALAWFVGARAGCIVDEEFPTACKMTSIISVDDEEPQQQQKQPVLQSIPELTPRTEGSENFSVFSAEIERPEQGDLVLLGRGVQQDYQLCSAVVTSVEASACTVAVLDDSRSYRIGECQANFSDLIAVNSEWRIGTRLVIGGLQSNNMSHLNGLVVIVCPHKRHGHPCFITKSSSDDSTSWLTVCVRMEDPSKCSIAAVLLEPRFLSPCTQQLQPSPRSPSAYSLRKQISMTRRTQMPSTPKASTQTKTPVTPASTAGGLYEKNNSLTSTASGSSGNYQKQNSSTSMSSAAVLPGSGESLDKKPSLTWKVPSMSPQSSSSSYHKQHSVPSLGPSSYQKNLSANSALSPNSCPKQVSLPSAHSFASSAGSSRRSVSAVSAVSEAEKMATEALQQEVQDLRRMLMELTQGSQAPRD
eukprot:TRINITY_DN6221_c0_g1_i2.p1 TRINITY_DN6221_c0_g1~~TRINITY_DN6221_c0_g1_i2.p1  ORF type:complete len:771 (+),score=140.71 TRINITY_DN6221_c0_g1_i2:108-2315(+)